MRRPRPPVPPQHHWSPCPEERRGRDCPLSDAISVRNLVMPGQQCEACGRAARMPSRSAVIEPGRRVLHWTCGCGTAQEITYPEHVDHVMCVAVRSGADVLRDDNDAIVTAAVLHARVLA